MDMLSIDRSAEQGEAPHPICSIFKSLFESFTSDISMQSRQINVFSYYNVLNDDFLEYSSRRSTKAKRRKSNFIFKYVQKGQSFFFFFLCDYGS